MLQYWVKRDIDLDIGQGFAILGWRLLYWVNFDAITFQDDAITFGREKSDDITPTYHDVFGAILGFSLQGCDFGRQQKTGNKKC